MDHDKLKKKYLPMTETAYYILLCLNKARHGYGIMQHVEEITNGRIKLGPGTIYGTLSKLEKSGLIIPIAEEDRRKIYELNENGRQILKFEVERLSELINNGNIEMED